MVRPMTSYWNGSAWVELVNPTADAHTSHSTAAGKSATVGFSVRDEIGLPRMMTARLQNASDNPFGNSGGEAKGHLTGTLTAFMPIKVVDSDNNDILFHGLVKDTIESYANDFGQVLDVIGEDYLMELRDTSTKNGLGYNIKLSGINLYDAVEKSDATDANIGRAGTEYTTFVSSRGGLIKSLITQFSNNLVHPGDADSSDDRFVESVAQFPTDTKYNLGGSGAKSVLAHILGLAIVDPHTTTRAVGEADFGYDYYASPGFTSTATSDDAKAYFNYFKRGTRPLGDPATYGLRVEYPSPGVTANGKFSQTGQLLAMTDFSFERPKDELFTEANVDFKQEVSKNEGDAVVSSKSAKMELWTVHTTTDVDDFVYKGKYIKGHPTGTNGVAGDNSESLKLTMTALNGALGSGGGDTSMPVDSVAGLYVGQLLTIGTSTEIISISAINSGTSTLTVVRENFPGSPQSHSDNAVVYARNVATIQWVTSDANADSDGTIYVLVSDIDPRLENDTTNIWVTGGSSKVWVGEVSGSSFKLKGRPYITHGVRRSTTFSTGSDSDPDSIRQSVLAKLKRGSYQIVRGDFKTYEAPRFYFDNSPTSVVSTAVTLSGSVNPKNYGFMVGMTVVKLDSNGNPTSTYGYASAVTTTVVTVNMSASISASDTLRYYVPVRAGNLIEVRNDLVNVSGKFLVTKSVYDTSSGGQAFTTFEVIGAEDIEGTGQARGDILSSLSNAAGTNEGLPANLPFSSSIANSSTDLEFESTDADEVIWHGAASDTASGTLIIDGETYTIGASNTGTMNSDGRDYWIYYTKGEAGLTTIEKSSWTTVANENTLLVGIAEYYSPEARFTIFVREFNTKHTKFAAADKIVKHTLTSVLAKKGMLGWTTNTVFSATGTADEYNKIKFGLKGTIANNSAVQFSDGETAEVVLSSTNVTWGNGNSSSMSGGKITLAAGVNYFYKTVGSTTLQVSATYSDAIADDKILMAMVLVASSDDGSSSPSIFPFNGSEATISTGVLSAGAIVAGSIQAGNITAAHLEASLVIANMFKTGSGVNDGSGSGEAGLTIDSNGIKAYKDDGTLKLHIKNDGLSTYYGPGGGDDDAARILNAAIMISNNGYVGYVSAGPANSDLRYDAADHWFHNFDTSGSPNMGYIKGLKWLDFGQTSGNDNRIQSADDIVIQTANSSDDIFLFVGGSERVQVEHDRVTINTNVYPNLDSAYEFGLDGTRWLKGWFDSVEAASYVTGDITLNNLNLEANSFDGTRGHWLIQEGADAVFIENKLTNKKYKFKLEEI